MATTELKTYNNFIGGEWVASSTGETYEISNPARKSTVLGAFQRSGAGRRGAGNRSGQKSTGSLGADARAEPGGGAFQSPLDHGAEGRRDGALHHDRGG